jgi:predicted nucleic acid-binding protein
MLVDLDILVDYLRGDERAVGFIQTNAERIILAAPVVAALYAGASGPADTASLDDVLGLFPVIPVSREIARAAGLYLAEFGRSHGLKQARAVMAAVTEAEQAELKTLDPGAYPMFGGLPPAW